MTIAELRAELDRYPGDYEVYVGLNTDGCGQGWYCEKAANVSHTQGAAIEIEGKEE